MRRILATTDLSDFAAAGLHWAAMLHRRTGATITVLYANQPWVPFDVIEGPAAYVLQNSPEFRERLDSRLREYVEKHLPGIAAERLIVEDAPAPAILETAKRIDADLIVMATHGRSGWQRAILGSVTESVVRHADRPVLCVAPADAPPMIRKILCPSDFASIGRRAVESAATLAESLGAELLIRQLPGGDAVAGTIRMADDAHADLLVIDTTPERVLRFAKRPVLAVQARETGRRREPAVA